MQCKKLLILLFLIVHFSAHAVSAGEYRQVPAIIDTRTTFSDGDFDVASLARLAKQKGFNVLFYNDHDRMAMAYGLFPFEHIIRYKKELNSINKVGADKYLTAINSVRTQYPDMVFISGSETVPFYYWKGSIFKKNLTAHDHEKRILIIGLERPEDYKNLPILNNGFSTRYLKNFLPRILVFLGAFILGIVLIMERGIIKIAGIVFSLFALLLLINTYPRSSPYDQYHGDQGIAPYQLVIDYVNAKGGMTFWNYPETRSGVREMGPIFVDTPPYPEALEQAINYTGFSAVYGENVTVTEPDNIWDRVLLEYCNGKRKRPVWGIATADFHKEGESGEQLGNYPTVFLVPNQTQKDILSAMQAGRMYACGGHYPQRIVLDEFTICSSDCQTSATLGEEIRLKGNPKIHISLSLKKPAGNQAKVRLIRSGELIKTFTGTLPMDIDFEDNYFKPGQKIYYRIDIRGPAILVSNPIFVTFQG